MHGLTHFTLRRSRKTAAHPAATSSRARSSAPHMRAAQVLVALTWLTGCTTHHWAEVQSSQLPPPESQAVRHSSRVIVTLSSETQEPQCVVGERMHPVCFYNLRPALERGLVRSLWP